jgi:Domain of unknown function (DUF6046)
MRFTTNDIVDPANRPSVVYLNDIQLPIDVIIGINGEKVIAESKILDGVVVFERISRKPFEINFEFTCREKNIDTGQYIFPQTVIEDLKDNVWQPDQVISVENTLLNKGFGIYWVVLKPISFTTIRGNTDVICSIKADESPDNNNNYGTTLIVPNYTIQ